MRLFYVVEVKLKVEKLLQLSEMIGESDFTHELKKGRSSNTQLSL